MTPSVPYSDLVQQAANAYRLPYDLLGAQMMVESSGDANAFRYEHDFWVHYLQGNPKTAGAKYGPLAACSYGLLQILLETALELGFTGRPEELFTPRVGLAWGAKKMRALWDWAGGTDSDYVQALAAYNGGTGGNFVVPFRNIAYAEKVYRQAGKLLG